MSTKQIRRDKVEKRKVKMCFPRKLVLLFYLLIFTFSFVYGETRFIQRLTWTGDEYSRRYEVVIEWEEAGTYREMWREFTTETFIEVPLLPGKYRCRVIPYNFLDQAGDASPWMFIEVVMASKNEIPFPPAEPVRLADIFLSAAWMPSFTVYDTKEDPFFGRSSSLAGTAVRFGVVLANGTSSESFFDFNPGLELAAFYSFFDAGSGRHLWGVALNLLVLKWLPGDKTALVFRLGAGYSVLFQINTGVSFLLFVMKKRNEFRMYLETGLEYAHWFKNGDMHPGSFRPWIGLGFSK